MIKLSFCLRRLPHLTREEFQRYWRETHAPLVRRHAAALRIHRYVQTHALLGEAADSLRASRGGPPGYDGVAELWWESDPPDDRQGIPVFFLWRYVFRPTAQPH